MSSSRNVTIRCEVSTLSMPTNRGHTAGGKQMKFKLGVLSELFSDLSLSGSVSYVELSFSILSVNLCLRM